MLLRYVFVLSLIVIDLGMDCFFPFTVVLGYADVPC